MSQKEDVATKVARAKLPGGVVAALRRLVLAGG